MNALSMIAATGDLTIAGRLMLASVMSHGGETPALFAFYSDLLRLAKARPARW